METPELLHIKFDGVNLETGTIDVYDFTTTILATADTLRSVANKIPRTKNAELKIEVKAIESGSFHTDLVISLKDMVGYGAALLPLVNSDTLNNIKEVIEVFKGVVSLTKFLEGEKPSKVETTIEGNKGTATVLNLNGEKMTVNLNIYTSYTDKQISSSIKKVFEPISKEGGNVDLIQISNPNDPDEQNIEVTKESVTFFKPQDDFQTFETYKARGIISAIDRKTYNGKINIGEDKRINFEVEITDIARLEPVTDALIDSMRSKKPIIVIGQASFDLESNIKKIRISDVEQDATLF